MKSDKKTRQEKLSPAKQSLVGAYNRIVSRLIYTGLKGADNSNAALKKLVEDAVEIEQAVEEMTSDEVHLLSEYVHRDLQLLGHYLHETGEGLAAWLNFDLNILEHSVKQQVIALADQTIVGNLALHERLECSSAHYLTGEICAPGTLRCLACGEQNQILKTIQIESCYVCQSDYFERVSK